MPPSMPPSTSGKRAAVSPVPRGSLSASGTTSVAGTSMCGGAAGAPAASAAAAAWALTPSSSDAATPGEELRHGQARRRGGEHLGLLPEHDGAVDLAGSRSPRRPRRGRRPRRTRWRPPPARRRPARRPRSPRRARRSRRGGPSGSAVTAGQAKASTMTATTPTRASAMPSTLPMGVRAVVASGWAAMVSSKKANVRSLL